MWAVTRQAYWHSGDYVVEIAEGGLQYCNPDMLVPRYEKHGEGSQFIDPREAVNAALTIRALWQEEMVKWPFVEEECESCKMNDGKCKAGGGEICYKHNCRIEVGSTGGDTMPFESYPTDKELREWAEKEYDSLERCARCGDILVEGNRWGHDFSDGFPFCSEHCADIDYFETYAEDDVWYTEGE